VSPTEREGKKVQDFICLTIHETFQKSSFTFTNFSAKAKSFFI
jgi:hypothetical protein